MGLQLYIKDVILNDVSKAGLPDKAEELDMEIASCRERIMMFASSSPRPVVDEDGHQIDWVEHVHFEMTQILKGLEEAIVQRHLVAVAIANPEDVEESY